MKKVFLDSSVLVAASASLTGASAYILGLCREKKIKGYISIDVINESRKNIFLKLNKKAQKRFIVFKKLANLIIVSPPNKGLIHISAKVINIKDAPILAAAIESKADFLVSLDRKDFLRPKVLEFAKPLKIILPGVFVMKYLR
ncbi:putative toxin-antitoxin system toxin component, PIN family [Candidatus Beckwithbacteria bacterium RBG_13_35_6]|uniref:Putative toxin-antitoxin system toxin component, PIN family n=1 Tax=Candidatus Beckwithbacteria bacterium RBG_13_35_6 TaxID=1797456 RepID=A0A1F5DH28_9BACT|nr:MAG: putative toxin-antitoxin system toxin component, PIN family [Candidatus Beckwithbacteria bacterium RBG_13_35_6]